VQEAALAPQFAQPLAQKLKALAQPGQSSAKAVRFSVRSSDWVSVRTCAASSGSSPAGPSPTTFWPRCFSRRTSADACRASRYTQVRIEQFHPKRPSVSQSRLQNSPNASSASSRSRWTATRNPNTSAL
jgi:hypothetical protein